MAVSITSVDFVKSLNFLEHCHKLFALVNSLSKGNGTAHRLRVVGKIVFLTGEMGLLSKAIHTAHNLDSIIERQFIVGICQLLLQGAANKFLIYCQNNDFIIGKQSLRDSLREAKAVELRAIDGFIIHRAKKDTIIHSLLFAVISVNTRSCGHV